MTLVGSRRMPCGHHRVQPTEPGAAKRRCDVCKVTHLFVVEPTTAISAKCGQTVWRIRWITPESTITEAPQGDAA